jgi:L-rhamnose mutarotase
MQTVAFRMTLFAGKRDEYARRHREIWPELAAALTAAGISDYWIFLDETNNHLFAVLKRRDDHTMDALAHLPVMRKWWDYMADLMETVDGNVPAQVPLAPVFHLA